MHVKKGQNHIHLSFFLRKCEGVFHSYRPGVKKIHDCMNFTVCRLGTIINKGLCSCTLQEKITSFFSNLTGLKCTYLEGRIGRIDYVFKPRPVITLLIFSYTEWTHYNKIMSTFNSMFMTVNYYTSFSTIYNFSDCLNTTFAFKSYHLHP
jgi:hypothetical protein